MATHQAPLSVHAFSAEARKTPRGSVWHWTGFVGKTRYRISTGIPVVDSGIVPKAVKALELKCRMEIESRAARKLLAPTVAPSLTLERALNLYIEHGTAGTYIEEDRTIHGDGWAASTTRNAVAKVGTVKALLARHLGEAFDPKKHQTLLHDAASARVPAYHVHYRQKLDRVMQETCSRLGLPKLKPLVRGEFYTPKDRHLTKAEFARLLDGLSPESRGRVAALGSSGMRIGEMCTYTYTAGTRVLHVQGTKNKAANRKLRIREENPWDAEAHAWLTANPNGIPPWGNAHRDLTRACKRAGVPTISAHDIRRSSCTWDAEAGKDMYTTMKRFGWTNVDILRKVYDRSEVAA